MALATRTRQTEIIGAGTLTVKVARPADDQGARSFWLGPNDRPHYVGRAPLTEPIEVSYTLIQDNGMLANMVERAKGNRTGSSVRAMYTAFADGRIHMDLPTPLIAAYVRSAANHGSHRRVGGPLTVKVKLLGEPTPYVNVCQRCERPGSEHVLGYEERHGGWVGTDNGHRLWSHEEITLVPRWWCPTTQEAAS